MGKSLVIFVDDSETALASTKMATSELPLEIIQYSSAITALSNIKAQNLKPDLIITDLNMPGMNGFEFIEALRVMDYLKRVPILMLTTERRDEMKSRGKALGLTGWIVKPFDAQQLRKAILRVVRVK